MRSAPPLSRHPILLLAFAFIVFGTLIEAQTPTSSSAPTATLSYASIVPSTTSYTYTGCYNETTGDAAAGDVRALAGGSMNASDTMTVELCLQFCGSYTYAGLEYGRECWCSSLLNSNSVKLPDANCTLRCSGDQSEVCGGSLMLTLYQRKSLAKSGATGRGCDRVMYGALVMALLAMLVL